VAWTVIILVAVGVLVWALIANALLKNPREDVETGLLCGLGWIYVRLVHRLSVRGREHIPQTRSPGGLIVVANHTAGIDPLLVQAACKFEIRWLMADHMRIGVLAAFWRWAKIIPVSIGGDSSKGVREALAYLAEGGVVGIFPEGGIERPARTVLPFYPGVGLLIRRARVPVLQVIIDGTPQLDAAWASLWHTSASEVTFLEPVDYRGSGLSAAKITEDLRRRYLDATGWPAGDRRALPLADGKGK
jgi:1-acyl-sn-glycerol-3-phosphate acyltransferase